MAWAILELTEDQIVRDLPAIRQIAKEFKTSAITLAIDEFSAGCSSFSSLRDLPVTELKLHALFVKNRAVDVTNAAICQTAIDLAHRFGSVVVAEGMLVAPHLPKDRFLDALRQHTNRPRAGDHKTQDGNERVVA